MPGSTTRTKTRSRDSINYNALQIVPFTTIAASIGAGVANTTVQDTIYLPFTCKIMGAYAGYTAIGAATGTHQFNVVTGTGTYMTAVGTSATTTLVVGGTVHTGDVLTANIFIPNTLLQTVGVPGIQTGVLGNPPVAGATQFTATYTVQSTDTTLTLAATGLAKAINSLPGLNDLIFANNTTGTINLTALSAAITSANNTLFNSISYTAGVTGTSATTTLTASGTLSGGTATTGVTPGVNDLFEYQGALVTPIVGGGTNTGSGITFYNGYNIAPAGTPLFNSDIALFAPPQGQNPWFASNFDVIYQQGQALTLRVTTPASTGSISNLRVNLAVVPFDIAPSYSQFNTFDPHQEIQ